MLRTTVRRIRRRDIQALAFCLLTLPLLFIALSYVLQAWQPAAVGALAYAIWLCTRARMIRVFRRLRGDQEVEWRGYYED
jgi:hypothetical protein